MEAHCVSCKEYPANGNLSVTKTKLNILFLLNSGVCGKKKSTSIEEKSSIILIINLKWTKSLTNFYWLQ